MSLSVFTDCFGNYNLNDVCVCKYARVCEQAVTWQLFLGGFNVCKQPTDWPRINLPFCLSLSYFPSLCLCLSVSWGRPVTYVQHRPLPLLQQHSHTHTFWVSDWKGYRLNSSPSFLVQHKSLSQHKKWLCVWETARERKRRGGAPTVKMLNVNFV